MADLWTPTQWNQMFRLLAKEDKEEPRQLTEKERRLIRLGTQTFGDLPITGEYPGSVIARGDSLAERLIEPDKPRTMKDILDRLQQDVYGKVPGSKKRLSEYKADIEATEPIEPLSTEEALVESTATMERRFRFPKTLEEELIGEKGLIRVGEVEALKKPITKRTPLQIRKDYETALKGLNNTNEKINKILTSNIVTPELISDAEEVDSELGTTDKILSGILQSLGVGQRITSEMKEDLLGGYYELRDSYTRTINEFTPEIIEKEKKKVINELTGDFPPVDNKGKTKMDPDTGKYYYSDGTSWREIEPVKR